MIESLTEEVESRTDILRHILIKLSKVEEENPFRFHESIESFKMVTTIDEADLVDEVVVESEEVADAIKTDVVSVV